MTGRVPFTALFMDMDKLSSRKSPVIRRFRLLAADRDYRDSEGLYLCDGIKTLREALGFGAAVRAVLWRDRAEKLPGLEGAEQYAAEGELFDYASPLKNSPGPLFAVEQPREDHDSPVGRAIVLENVQDPGNVGTVIRSAAAFGMDAVILTGACADLYNPKTVRAAMGAVFRQRVLRLDRAGLTALLEKNGLPLYGAALSEKAEDLRRLDLEKTAVAIGSEGSGLSPDMLERCAGQMIIPMSPGSESLNAAVAAAVIMWEMVR